MKRFTKLLYVLIVFSMLLMPYTTVYAEDTPGGNTADGTPVPSGSIAGPSAEGDYLGGVDPTNQRDIMMRLEIPYYNAQECAEGTSPSDGESDGTISGKDNEEKIFNFLRTATFGGHKLNAAQIAGIMGSLKAESSNFDPNAGGDSGSHRGIAQWGSRWNDSLKGSLEKQLQFIKKEMDSGEWHDRLERNGFFKLGNSKEDAVAAAYIFTRNYEVAIRNGGGGEKWDGNDGEADNFLQNWYGRKNNATTFYDKYSSKVDGPAPSGGAGRGPGRNIWFGDSRTVGMHNAVGDSGDVWVAKDSMGYDWFNGEGLKQVNSSLEAGDTIVINFGINDPGNVQQYIKRINELAKTDWKSNKVVVMAINPIDEGRAHVAGYKVTTTQINDFNDAMKNGLNGSNIQFVDTNSMMRRDGYSTQDGIHYTADTYKKLHDNFLNQNNANNSTPDAKAADNCAPSENSTNGGPTEYAKDGAIIYNQKDSRWANKPFGPKTISAAGCGPSAMAMIITALTHQSVTPDQVAAVGGADPGGDGSSWTLPTTIANSGKWPIRVDKISRDKIDNVLTSGGMVWMCGKGGPIFGDGHCIGIRGRNANDKWLIFDSGITSNSNKEWDRSVIYDGLDKNHADASLYAVWAK